MLGNGLKCRLRTIMLQFHFGGFQPSLCYPYLRTVTRAYRLSSIGCRQDSLPGTTAKISFHRESRVQRRSPHGSNNLMATRSPMESIWAFRQRLNLTAMIVRQRL